MRLEQRRVPCGFLRVATQNGIVGGVRHQRDELEIAEPQLRRGSDPDERFICSAGTGDRLATDTVEVECGRTMSQIAEYADALRSQPAAHGECVTQRSHRIHTFAARQPGLT